MISCRGAAVVVAFTFASAAVAGAQGRALPASGRADTLAIAVAGSGLDHLTTAVIHSVRGKPTRDDPTEHRNRRPRRRFGGARAVSRDDGR